MVKMEHENGKCQVIAVGDIVQIVSEIGGCIRHLWRELSLEDQEAMKGMMQHMMTDESPVWKAKPEGPVS